MRHRVAHRKLGRTTEHRIALLRNQAEALLRHEHIETTVPKAKELRPFVEHLISVAKRGLASGAGPRVLQARRLVLRDVQDRTVVAKLFDSIAPRFAARPGGYTRLLRIGFRRGDSAEMAQVELVGSEYDPSARAKESVEGEATPDARKSVGGRIREAAKRLRGEAPKADAKASAAKKPKAGQPRKKAKAKDEAKDE